MKKASLQTFLLLLWLIPLGWSEESFQPPSVTQRGAVPPGAYSLAENLSQAGALRVTPEGQSFPGVFTDGRFSFAGLAGNADIFVSDSGLVEGLTRTAIWFPPLEGMESTLTFHQVPRRRKLHVFFALPDTTTQQKDLLPVQFEIWMGKKNLFHTRLSTKGWQEKVLDLTLPYLLQKSYQISFKVRMSDNQSKDLIFYGYLQ